MLPLGCYRQYHTTNAIKNPTNMTISLLNGVLYATPYGCLKLYHLYNRYDNKMNYENPKNHINDYYELVGANYNLV
jgi:hypothetical protein